MQNFDCVTGKIIRVPAPRLAGGEPGLQESPKASPGSKSPPPVPPRKRRGGDQRAPPQPLPSTGRERTRNAPSPERSAIMRAVKSRDTQPELVVRKLLWSIAPGYRLYRADLPGKPDIVYARRRLAIFVHGCFWHGHDCARGARAAADQRRLLVRQDRSQSRPRRNEPAKARRAGLADARDSRV